MDAANATQIAPKTAPSFRSLLRTVVGNALLTFVPAAGLTLLLLHLDLIRLTYDGELATARLYGLADGIFAAFMETALMVPLLWALSRMGIHGQLLLLASAAVWALYHARIDPFKAWIVLFPFYMLTRLYVSQEMHSKSRAYWVTSSAHLLHNIFCSILYLFVID